MQGSWTDTPPNFRAFNAWYTRHALNIGEKQFIHWKKARTHKNLQLYSWFILELKMLGRRNLHLNHPGMSLHTNFKVLGRLPEFLIPKMTSTQLCSETNSTSLPTGLLCTENIKSSTDKFDPKLLLNLNKLGNIRRTFSRAFFSH